MKNIVILLLLSVLNYWSLHGIDKPFYNTKEANSSYFDQSGLEKLSILKDFMANKAIQEAQLKQLLDNCLSLIHI